MTISGLASEMLEPLQSCVLHNKQDNQQTSRLSYQEYSNNISFSRSRFRFLLHKWVNVIWCSRSTMYVTENVQSTGKVVFEH